MKVKELTKPLIIKKINFILFPLLAIIFIWTGTLIYQWRSEQALRLGKLQARITSLNMLNFVKGVLSNYIDVCDSYNNMAKMHKEVETWKQAEYLKELTKYVLTTNPDVFALRCNFNPQATEVSEKMKIVSGSESNNVTHDIDQQFYKLGLLEHKRLSNINNVTVTAPYKVQSTDDSGVTQTYNVISFYKAIVNLDDNVIGHSCVDIQASTIAKLMQELQGTAEQSNCEVHLYLNEDKKFVDLADNSIQLQEQTEELTEELMTIINDGYEAEYDNRQAMQYFFVMPTSINNFSSELTVVASFPYFELTKSIGDFAAWLFWVMLVAYLLVAALLFYINRRLYKRFVDAEVIMLKNHNTNTITQGTL